jgi:hypothetical protein
VHFERAKGTEAKKKMLMVNDMSFCGGCGQIILEPAGSPSVPIYEVDCESFVRGKRENVCSRSTSRADKIAAALPNVVQRKEQSCDAFCDTRMCTAKMACRVFQERERVTHSVCATATIIVARR